jgi:hypothetical protein
VCVAIDAAGGAAACEGRTSETKATSSRIKRIVVVVVGPPLCVFDDDGGRAAAPPLRMRGAATVVMVRRGTRILTIAQSTPPAPQKRSNYVISNVLKYFACLIIK